ncbi:MAG: 16S rRNA (cytosine(1402)-N(4))-methyltransferase RsmH [Candidatus Omnitrophica bacterium]|nr:16S rRNA (cytosine(1402)-N(4))-methyltransferase RsmH [Candidatus Omnitrophota bacterium]
MKILEEVSKILPHESWCRDEEAVMERHTPVMLAEVLTVLRLSPGKFIVDCTVGEGGHTAGILSRIVPGGYLLGLDQDDDALEAAQQKLACYDGSFRLVNMNFKNIRAALQADGKDCADGFVFDLGVSMMQLSSPERGFSFRLEGPLNMRMDKRGQITAFDLVNNLSEDEIATVLYRFGQEYNSRRIAARIVGSRQRSPIGTTSQLAEIVYGAVPEHERHKKIHPATKTFMALRIAVNRELEAVQIGVREAVDALKPGGRICVISFHSLEDRIVKQEFRALAKKGVVELVTKKPLVPNEQEMRENPRSRSAKMRVAQKK